MTDLREQEMQSQIDALSSTAENWKNTAKNLKTENQMLKAQVAQLQKMVYGSRTEKTKRILPETADGQLNLFNEAEVEAKRNAPEPCIEVPAHQRRKKQKDHTAELLAKFPHEERLITLPEEERVCKRCGTALTSMGKEKIRTEIEFIPAKVNVIDYYRESFQCLACRKEAHFSIEKPAMPQPVIAKSIASPSSVAHVMVQKYQQSMPLYRQEREWKEIGIPLSRATLANWVIRPAEDWLMPLVSRLQQDLLQQDVIHADETPVQVHKEKGRKNPAKSYMWVFSSGEYEQAHPIRLYEYQPGRSGSYAEDFLKGFNGILQTDGYTGYQKAPCHAHALCWAHARRYFIEAIPPDLPKEDLLGSICKKAIEQINELFAIDKGLAGLTKEEREEQRLQLEKEKLEAYFAWLQDIELNVLPKSKLGKAVQYSLSHKEALQAFLKSGNAALSNNICERAIRNFTIGRKNWLFSDSPKGAKASAAVYSIIETANANGLNPFQYLKYLFEHLPNADIKRHPEHLDDVLPWNETIQQNCK